MPFAIEHLGAIITVAFVAPLSAMAKAAFKDNCAEEVVKLSRLLWRYEIARNHRRQHISCAGGGTRRHCKWRARRHRMAAGAEREVAHIGSDARAKYRR